MKSGRLRGSNSERLRLASVIARLGDVAPTLGLGSSTSRVNSNRGRRASGDVVRGKPKAADQVH